MISSWIVCCQVSLGRVGLTADLAFKLVGHPWNRVNDWKWEFGRATTAAAHVATAVCLAIAAVLLGAPWARKRQHVVQQEGLSAVDHSKPRLSSLNK